MNPIVFQFGPLTLHSFTAWIAFATLIGIILVLSSAVQRGERLTPTVDVLVAGVVGGAIGARAFHVWLNWVYFSEQQSEIDSFASGGLDWHGAVVVGLAAMVIVALIRRVNITALFDVLALVFGISTAAGWLASVSANSLYGVEVRTLADYPAWLVTESPDVYSTIAPRINLLPLGLALSAAIFAIVLILTLSRRLSGSRLPLAISLFSIGMALIGIVRLDYSPEWLGRRGDQVLDIGLAVGAFLLFGIMALWRLRTQRSGVIRGSTVKHVEQQT